MLNQWQKHAEIKSQIGRKTCSHAKPSTLANKTQGGKATPSHFGPQNQVFTTEIPLEFSG